VKLDTLKDLKRVIKLCRSEGVDSIRIDNVEIHLAQLPVKRPTTTQQLGDATTFSTIYTSNNITDETIIPTFDDLTEEQKLFYSAVPHDQDPAQ